MSGPYGWDVEFSLMLLCVAFFCLCIAGVGEALHNHLTRRRRDQL